MRVLVFCLFVYISFTYTSVWLADFLPRFDHWFGNILGLLSVGVFHYFVAQLGVNYYLCLTSSPGAVPSAWKPDGMPEKQLETIKQACITSRHFANPKSIRYCRYCLTYKPPSSHHCTSCKICVVRKDHHCPWINNCVGLRNHKYFILFLLYATLGCCFSIALHLTTIVTYLSQHRTSPNANNDNNNPAITTTTLPSPVSETFELTVPVCVMMAISLFLLIPVTLVLSTLLVWQVWLSVNDQTTIEAEWDAAHKYSKSHSSSNNNSSNSSNSGNKDEATSNDDNNKGRLVRYTHNLSQIFGPFSYHWLMPTKPRLRLPSYLEGEEKGFLFDGGHRDLEV